MTIIANMLPISSKLEKNPPSFVVDNKNQSLHSCVRETLRNYFTQLKGEDPSNLYQLIRAEIEKPLLDVIMSYLKGNQSKTATLLGLSRGTLRKMLKVYEMID